MPSTGGAVVWTRVLVLAGFIVLAVAACAPAIVQKPTQLAPAEGKSFRLGRAAEPSPSEGSATTLRAGTRWELVGVVSQGEVYRTRDQVVTLQGDDIHEGYIVVSQGALVGFYLPVERAFSPAKRLPLAIEP